MLFFRFDQNNSGGYFDGYHNVIVEANTPEQANLIAAHSGYVYFGDRGDCIECCGFRWSEFWDGDTEADGYSIYSTVEEAKKHASTRYFTSTGDSVVLHFNGKVEEF